MALAALHPRRIMQALDAIDAEAPSYSLSRPAALRRVFAVLAAVCVSLLILHYSRYSTNFHALLGYLGQWRMQDAHYYLRALEASGVMVVSTSRSSPSVGVDPGRSIWPMFTVLLFSDSMLLLEALSMLDS